jgi:hypothetical protein
MPTARSIGTVLSEARTLLQDKDATNYRYSDDELLEALNGAFSEARQKRPDLFLGSTWGLRGGLPYFTSSDSALAFPLAPEYYNAFVYYVVGRTSLRDDTYADDSRAVTLMNKFVSQLMQVAS